MAFILVPIGKELRLLRKKTPLTIKELSKLSKVSEPTISKLENGENVNIDSLIKVSDALNKNIKLRLTNKRNGSGAECKC